MHWVHRNLKLATLNCHIRAAIDAWIDTIVTAFHIVAIVVYIGAITTYVGSVPWPSEDCFFTFLTVCRIRNSQATIHAPLPIQACLLEATTAEHELLHCQFCILTRLHEGWQEEGQHNQIVDAYTATGIDQTLP